MNIQPFRSFLNPSPIFKSIFVQTQMIWESRRVLIPKYPVTRGLQLLWKHSIIKHAEKTRMNGMHHPFFCVVWRRVFSVPQAIPNLTIQYISHLLSVRSTLSNSLFVLYTLLFPQKSFVCSKSTGAVSYQLADDFTVLKLSEISSMSKLFQSISSTTFFANLSVLPLNPSLTINAQ